MCRWRRSLPIDFANIITVAEDIWPVKMSHTCLSERAELSCKSFFFTSSPCVHYKLGYSLWLDLQTGETSPMTLERVNNKTYNRQILTLITSPLALEVHCRTCWANVLVNINKAKCQNGKLYILSSERFGLRGNTMILFGFRVWRLPTSFRLEVWMLTFYCIY